MPYIPPTPPQQAKPAAPVVKPELDAQPSSITPAFISSSFEPTSKSGVYSLLGHAKTAEIAGNPTASIPTLPVTSDVFSQHSLPLASTVESAPGSAGHSPKSNGPPLGTVESTETSPTLPDTSDLISQQSLSRASTTSTTPTAGSKRASWSHRKPVPPVIPLLTNSLPSSHPFARGAQSPGSRGDLDSPPVTPRSAGPVPPRRPGAHNRSISNLASPASPALSELSEGSAILWRPSVQKVGLGDEDGVEELSSDVTETSEPSPRSSSGKRMAGPKLIPSRQSSRHSTPIQSQAPELGAPVSLDHRTVSSVSTHESGQFTPPVTAAQHPLRLRIDKSLPDLPLDTDAESTHRRPVSRHKVNTSTSSGPSTQIITPRSNSHGNTSQSEKAGDQEKRKVKWPKSLVELARSRKDKSADSGDGDKTATSAQVDPEEDESFSVDRIPSKRRLFEAGTLFLRDENGDLVSFGDMFPKTPILTSEDQPMPPIPRTVIFFIRHFWCGQCQDFMFASLSQLDPVAIEKAGIKVIVISNGSWKIIKSYKNLFRCPFPIYVDGPRKLYSLLGMTKMTNDFGPSKGRAAYNVNSVPKQLLKGGKNAITKMPFAYPGKLTQLGGEFILSPGYNCDFAHRMTNTSNHMEAPDVLREAGCQYPTKAEIEEITIADDQRMEFERLEKEMQAWRAQRETELDRIRRRKAERRGEQYTAMSNGSKMALGLGEDEGPDGRRQSQASMLAQMGVSLPADAPATSTATRANDAAGAEALPTGSVGDALTWDDDEEEETTLKPELNALFEKAVRLGEIEPSGMNTPTRSMPKGELEMEDIKGEFAGDTFGRKGSPGSGLEVKIVQ